MLFIVEIQSQYTLLILNERVIICVCSNSKIFYYFFYETLIYQYVVSIGNAFSFFFGIIIQCSMPFHIVVIFNDELILLIVIIIFN